MAIAPATKLAPSATTVVPQRETLPDGSLVELKPGALVSHDFAGTVRRVTLHQGEAHFQVTKNPARPFVVRAGNVDIRGRHRVFRAARVHGRGGAGQ